MPISKKKKPSGRDLYYQRQALKLAKEAEVTMAAVRNCLEKSEMFPIYLKDLRDQVDALIAFQVAHNVLNYHMGPKPK